MGLGIYPTKSPASTLAVVGRQTDGFSVFRTSIKTVSFDYAGKYDLGPLLWDTVTAGTGTATHNTTTGTVTLSTGGTASGARCFRQTRKYNIYSPGKSRQCAVGVLFGAAVTNAVKRAGLFDDSNGIFLEQTGTDIAIVIRDGSSGSPVDTRVVNFSWNIDKMDGTGPSGVTLNLSNSQGLIIELTGYNAASFRVGFLIGGEIYYAHSIANQNSSSAFGIATATLPIRYEVLNSGTATGTATIIQSSVAVWDENGNDTNNYYLGSASNGITEKAVTTRVPILSIRPKLSFGGISNRGHVLLKSASAMARTNSAYIELIRNGTLTGPSWTSCGSNSLTEFDVTASAISGGDRIIADYAASSVGSSFVRSAGDIGNIFELSTNYDASSADIISVVATSMTGTSNIVAAMNFSEAR